MIFGDATPLPLAHHPLAAALAGISLLILLIAVYKVHAFVGLLIASLVTGLFAGMPLADIVKGFQDGLGNVLAGIAAVVGLGTILGKLLGESGGAASVAARIVTLLGARLLPVALTLTGLIVGLPLFFGVGVVLLTPILLGILKRTSIPRAALGIPLVAGLSAAHGLVPPHPGPLAAIELLHADTGMVLIYSLITALPCALLAGPIFMRMWGNRVSIETRPMKLVETQGGSATAVQPAFGPSLAVILFPILLMLLPTLFDPKLVSHPQSKQWIDFIGSPLVALLLGLIFAIYLLGIRTGMKRDTISRFVEESLGPVAQILLVVGAGGGFSRILILSGVGTEVAALGSQFHIPILVFGWLIAALVRVATGSATVAITTAAGLLFPLTTGLTDTRRALLVVSTGAGSLILSHLNDGGFWFVKEYFNFSVAETFKTWTVTETIISVAGLAMVLLLGVIV